MVERTLPRAFERTSKRPLHLTCCIFVTILMDGALSGTFCGYIMAGAQSLFQITVVRGFTAQTLDSPPSLIEITASMTRWEQVEKLCQAVLELEANQRSAFLEEACGGDEGLRREVESLLRFDKRGERFIEQPAAELAAKMIAHGNPESLIGQKIGSYQILSLLGAAGMGVVYRARDSRLNRTVAIKVLSSEKVSDPERKRRFTQEARAASALNHPNVITIHDLHPARPSRKRPDARVELPVRRTIPPFERGIRRRSERFPL